MSQAAQPSGSPGAANSDACGAAVGDGLSKATGERERGRGLWEQDEGTAVHRGARGPRPG